MCYSAQAWQDYEKYVREFDATLSIKDYIRLFWDQATKGSPYRIPKAMMDAFASPADAGTREIQDLIQTWKAIQASCSSDRSVANRSWPCKGGSTITKAGRCPR